MGILSTGVGRWSRKSMNRKVFPQCGETGWLA